MLNWIPNRSPPARSDAVEAAHAQAARIPGKHTRPWRFGIRNAADHIAALGELHGDEQRQAFLRMMALQGFTATADNAATHGCDFLFSDSRVNAAV
jgi:hypothetical protein